MLVRVCESPRRGEEFTGKYLQIVFHQTFLLCDIREIMSVWRPNVYDMDISDIPGEISTSVEAPTHQAILSLDVRRLTQQHSAELR